jgi:biopolymer transport protein ExbB
LDLNTLIQKGGVIVEILLALNFIGFTILIWKFISLNIAKSNLTTTAKDLLHNFPDKTKINIQIEKYTNELEYGLNTIKIIAQISPLLGLLGTVIGVLSIFDTIGQSGLGNPTLFSSGISVALITTIVGLIVSIPHYIGYNYLIGFVDRLEILLKEKI